MQRPTGDVSNQYEEFEIQVGRGRVHVLRSPEGEAYEDFQLPFGPSERDALRSWLERAAHTRDLRPAQDISQAQALTSLSMDDLQRIGEQLFVALFTKGIYSLYERSRASVRARGLPGLRIKLRLAEDAESLPWELLYDPKDDYLALSPDLTLVRFLDAQMPQRPLKVDPPLRVLLVAGAPQGLDLEAEVNGILKVTSDLVAQQRLDIDVLRDASVDSLYERLFLGQKQRREIHVVHFLGHGEAPNPTAPARLLFYNEMHQPEPVEITHIWRMLRRIDSLRLIWLNSCSGAVGKEGMLYGPLASAAARFVAAGVPAVIANQLRISDRVAQRLARTFYTFLAEGQPIDVALAEARFRVSGSDRNSLEWATPIIYMRAPDGVLFTTAEATSAAAPATNAPPTNASQPATSSPSPNDEEQQFVSEQIRTLRRRLQQRQLQAAKYGIGVDPAISIEIEDLQKEIAQWEAKLPRR
jgi:hypothetical protein